MNVKDAIPGALILVFCAAYTPATVFAEQSSEVKKGSSAEDMKQLPASYWRDKLTPQVYQVTRCSATEPAFTGKYWNNHEPGIYRCSNCGTVLFESKDKFDSGTGWPSFSTAKKDAVEIRVDKSFGMNREEVICKHCGAHLGHLFPDGPAPTGQRYCINSASLGFQKEQEKAHEKK